MIPLIFLITLLVSFSSIAFELILAQTLSALIGNTLIRYNVTIGVYLASLGIGAFLVRKNPPEILARQLFSAEIALLILGGSSPVICLILDHALRDWVDSSTTLFNVLLNLGVYVLTAIIGIFSGMEIPLLIYLGESLKRGISGRILAADYTGTLVGVVAFPLVLIPSFSLFGIAGIVSLCNAVAAFCTGLFFCRHSIRLFEKIFFAFWITLLLWTLIFQEKFAQELIDTYYLPKTEVIFEK